MHFCSAEIESLCQTTSPIPIPTLRPSSPRPSNPPRDPRPKFHSYNPKSRPLPMLSPNPIPLHWSDTAPPNPSTSEQQDLENALEELEEGLDVLMILERAYEQTLKAHIIPTPDPPPTPSQSPSASPSQNSSIATQPLPIPSVSFSSSSFKFSSPSPPKGANPGTIPLLAGSSTAILAVLDDVPRQSINPASLLKTSTKSEQESYDAVIKIAHIGDCMGMLVRGEDIVWRSEEMWWGVSPFPSYFLSPPLCLFITHSPDLHPTVQHPSPTGPHLPLIPLLISSPLHSSRSSRRYPYPRQRWPKR